MQIETFNWANDTVELRDERGNLWIIEERGDGGMRVEVVDESSAHARPWIAPDAIDNALVLFAEAGEE